MIKMPVTVTRKDGIHERPATEIVEICRKFGGKVTLCNGCTSADGCSILQVTLLAAMYGSIVEVLVDGNVEGSTHPRIVEVTTLLDIVDVFEDGAGI